jgi:hypothetical protein
LKEFWLDRLIEIIIANPSKLNFGQEVLHGDLQRFDYDLGDLHTPYSNGEEDMEFTKVIVWELNYIAMFGPLKQILSGINKFCRCAHLQNKSWETISFGSKV